MRRACTVSFLAPFEGLLMQHGLGVRWAQEAADLGECS